jgi:hypothetical protein
VLLGPPNSIKNLQELGFKTFDRWWDESYDQILDNEQRLLAVVKIIEHIYSQPTEALHNLCDEMQDVLEYNFYHHVNNFKSQQLDMLEKFCKQNLLPRYD